MQEGALYLRWEVPLSRESSQAWEARRRLAAEQEEWSDWGGGIKLSRRRWRRRLAADLGTHGLRWMGGLEERRSVGVRTKRGEVI